MKRSTVVRVTAAALLIAATSSCASFGQLFGTEFRAEPSQAVSIKPCPPQRRYSEKEQRTALEALEQALERGGYGAVVLDQMIDDYHYMRKACR